MPSDVWQHLLIFALLYIPGALYLRRKRAARKLQVLLFLALSGTTVFFIMLDFGLLPSLQSTPDGELLLLMLMSWLLALAVFGYCSYRVRSPWAFVLGALSATFAHSYPLLMDFARARKASEATLAILGHWGLAAVVALGLGSGILASRAYFIRRASGDRI